MTTACLITDTPEHPVLREMIERLGVTHEVRVLDPESGADPDTVAAGELASPADVYLLKAHAPRALALGRRLEELGMHVANSVRASAFCQDRLAMARRLDEAGVPAAAVLTDGTVDSLCAADVDALTYPVLLKSRANHRGDLVALVRSREELLALRETWATEEVVVQEFIANDGWDIKLWVVGRTVFAARRPTPLDTSVAKQTIPVGADELPAEWVQLALAVGTAFDLDLYGLDLLVTERGPLVIDVNSFPGYRGVPGAAEALTSWVDAAVATAVTTQASAR